MKKVLNTIFEKIHTIQHLASMTIVASILLFLAALLAAVMANSSLAPAYQEFLSQQVSLQIGDFNLFSHGEHSLTVLQFINDGLMTLFFFLVGIEINESYL